MEVQYILISSLTASFPVPKIGTANDVCWNESSKITHHYECGSLEVRRKEAVPESRIVSSFAEPQSSGDPDVRFFMGGR